MTDRYRVSLKNYSTGKRELLWEGFTSKKKGYEWVDKYNDLAIREHREPSARLYDMTKKQFI